MLKWHLLFTLLYGVVLYFINAMIFILLDKIFVKNRFHVKRLIVGFLASFFISGLAVFVLRIVEEVLIEKVPFSEFIKEETPNNYVFAIVVTLIRITSYNVCYTKLLRRSGYCQLFS